MKDSAETNYKVDIEEFEGPLDLLLHLIKINEIDVYDIPISAIVKQYIEYIEMMENFNIEIAGDFIVMAATLMRIKARMLVPNPNSDEDDDFMEDPRAELVERLLEYKKFKELSYHLGEKLKKSCDIFSRNFVVAEQSDKRGIVNIVGTDLFNLLSSYKTILTKLDRRLPEEIEGEEYSVEEKSGTIVEKLQFVKFVRFTELFQNVRSRKELVTTFLAVLELIKIGQIKVEQNELFNEIYIYRKE
jgi:segregation and condensation protein A